jgi:hypothetical protein
MTMIITHDRPGAFAHLLPPKEPSLADLAREAINTANTFRHFEMVEPPLTDGQWRRLDNAKIDARKAFRERFFAETGLSSDVVAMLIEEGAL